MVLSGLIKDKKKILFFQTIYIAIYTVGNIILGGITGAIVNIINIIRNIICYKDKLNVLWKVIISIITIALCLYFDKINFYSINLLIGAVIFIWCMDVKNVIKFKILLVYSVITWLIYDFHVKNYVNSIFDIVTIITNIISIIQIKSVEKSK